MGVLLSRPPEQAQMLVDPANFSCPVKKQRCSNLQLDVRQFLG